MGERDVPRRNTNSAPVLPIDIDAEGYIIRTCFDCYPSHAEVVTDPETGRIMVREWHAIGCLVFDDPDDEG